SVGPCNGPGVLWRTGPVAAGCGHDLAVTLRVGVADAAPADSGSAVGHALLGYGYARSVTLAPAARAGGLWWLLRAGVAVRPPAGRDRGVRAVDGGPRTLRGWRFYPHDAAWRHPNRPRA